MKANAIDHALVEFEHEHTIKLKSRIYHSTTFLWNRVRVQFDPLTAQSSGYNLHTLSMLK